MTKKERFSAVPLVSIVPSTFWGKIQDVDGPQYGMRAVYQRGSGSPGLGSPGENVRYSYPAF